MVLSLIKIHRGLKANIDEMGIDAKSMPVSFWYIIRIWQGIVSQNDT